MKDKASLAFGRTSAGIELCFRGLHGTIWRLCMALSENNRDKCHPGWSYLHIYKIITLIVQRHGLAVERKRERGLFTAPRVEHTQVTVQKKSTKTTFQNNIKINIGPKIFKRTFNHQECSEKCLWGGYIIKAFYINKNCDMCHTTHTPLPLPIILPS